MNSLFVCMLHSFLHLALFAIFSVLQQLLLPLSALFPYTTLFRSEPGDVPSRLAIAGDLPAEHPTFFDGDRGRRRTRSEEHTSELQSTWNIVCRLLLEKKKKIKFLA